MKQTDPQYKLRIPPDLKEQIEIAAKASGRSMNAEIVARLEQSFAAPASETGASLNQAIQELQSLQTLATLNYRLERAIYKADLTKTHLGLAHQQVQAAAAGGSKAEQKEAREVLTELQGQMDQYRATIDAIEKQIAEIHLERKVTGLKELRDVEAISAAVQIGFKSRH